MLFSLRMWIRQRVHGRNFWTRFRTWSHHHPKRSFSFCPFAFDLTCDVQLQSAQGFLEDCLLNLQVSFCVGMHARAHTGTHTCTHMHTHAHRAIAFLPPLKFDIFALCCIVHHETGAQHVPVSVLMFPLFTARVPSPVIHFAISTQRAMSFLKALISSGWSVFVVMLALSRVLTDTSSQHNTTPLTGNG